MSSHILDEYLIKLGSTVDQSGIRHFQNTLRDVASSVDHESLRMAGSFFKAQTEIVGGFAAIGAAAIGMVDKVAMADQEYRLFALHMYMSKDAARSLKIAMDALGAPLEDLTWDPELRARTTQLINDQRAMAPTGDFDEQMKKVRDIRFEFTRMGVELKYLSMHTALDFLHALGVGPDDLLAKLRKFNDWVIHDMPGIARKLTSEFMPIWNDIKEVAKSTGEALYNAGVLFVNTIGLLSGDDKLMGTTLSMEKLASATHHVADGFAFMAKLIAHVESLLSHMISALALVSSGKFSEAGNELKAGLASVSDKELTTLIGGAVGFSLGGPVGGAVGASLGSKIGLDGQSGSSMTKYNAADLHDVARMAGVPPDLLMALAMTESGMHQTDAHGGTLRSKAGALGLMQLMPGTAKQYGVDPNNAIANATGGAYYLRDLLKKYGDPATAIGAYNWGPGNMDKFLAGRATMPSETRGEIASVMRRMGATGSVTVGSVTINIKNPNATPDQIQQAVTKGVREATEPSVQRNLAEFNGLGWSY